MHSITINYQIPQLQQTWHSVAIRLRTRASRCNPALSDEEVVACTLEPSGLRAKHQGRDGIDTASANEENS